MQRSVTLRVFESLDEIDLPDDRQINHVAVGSFDGLHQAHAILMGRVAGEAHATGGRALVFTFRNHPRSVVAPEKCPKLLSSWPLKRRLLERMPLDYAIAVKFDQEFASIPAQQFVEEILVGRCGARTIHSGVNFHFGRGGQGNPGLLAEMADHLGYRYEQLEPVLIGGRRVSSTRVRQELTAGHVAEAAELLGRPHQVDGVVVTGDSIGRTIGFPTANLHVDPEILIPPDGVYAAAVFIEDEKTHIPAMMNIGYRPTVNGKDRRIEVHLLDFDADLVGRDLTLQFIRRLRDEHKFDNLDALRKQLATDKETAWEVLSGLVTERY
ncbi:bifunctional riboflavin kinase/FAD synthetase [bacterium]|nr:bifunctional riboflavin kinase/FAD synthetase [bacterium]